MNIRYSVLILLFATFLSIPALAGEDVGDAAKNTASDLSTTGKKVGRWVTQQARKVTGQDSKSKDLQDESANQKDNAKNNAQKSKNQAQESN